jgi:hypothetical protein
MSNQMTPLRRRMIDDMMIRDLSPLTQKIYGTKRTPRPGRVNVRH